MNKLTAQIASLPDRENVVFEIYSDNDQVAEISNEPEDGLHIEIFTCSNGKKWNFDFNEFSSLISKAKANIS